MSLDTIATQPSESDLRYMRMALDEAREAYAAGEIPIGAVLVCGDRVLARTHNRVESLGDPTAHAEVLAITAGTEALGGKYLSDCTLYVTVEPCVMCAGALGWAQLPRLVYGCPEAKFGYKGKAPGALHPRCNVVGGVLAAEAADLMRSFFSSRR